MNAFVNAKLEKDIYMRMPPGYRKPGILVKLYKALYGLRELPLLWQKNLTQTLVKLGFYQIPHELYYYLKGSMLIFFYVDDIVMAFRDTDRPLADQTIVHLKDHY